MKFAKISNDGTVVKYPYTLRDLRADHPHTSFAKEIVAEALADLGVVAVAATDKIENTDAINKNVVEDDPAKVDGVWTQQWKTVDASATEIASRTAIKADTDARAEIKADKFVAQFVDMTPTEVASYIETNVTTLATAKTVLTKLALIVLLLARREFK